MPRKPISMSSHQPHPARRLGMKKELASPIDKWQTFEANTNKPPRQPEQISFFAAHQPLRTDISIQHVIDQSTVGTLSPTAYHLPVIQVRLISDFTQLRFSWTTVLE